MGITGPLAGYLIMRFGYSAMFLSASSAALCGCMILAVLLYRMRNNQARELSTLLTFLERFVDSKLSSFEIFDAQH